MDLIQHAICDIDGVELQTVANFDVEDSDDTTLAKAMTRRRRAIGKQRGIPEFSGSARVFVATGTHGEVDWDSMNRTKSEHVWTYEEDDGGTRWILEGWHVTSIKKSFDAEGNAMWDISWKAFDHYKAP
jgi:hypothetical protein